MFPYFASNLSMETHKIILFNLVMNLLRYFVLAGLAYFIFYKLKRNAWAKRKIQAKFPDSSQVQREIKNSLVSIFIFALVAILLFTMNQFGWLQIYFGTDKHHVPYFCMTVVVLILFHDTYFYWTHRLLHHPRLMRFHLIHHKSLNTNPFTAFSFHPVEALVQTGFIFIIVFIPIDAVALALVLFWQMAFNVMGHLGYEIIPPGFHRTWIGRYFNTVTHHNMHHRFSGHNFGLYFNFWDRWMSTNHEKYEEKYAENARKMFSDEFQLHEPLNKS